MINLKHRKILFCALNWGLGHASRSIPVIDQLIDNQNEVTLASDGLALQLLQRTFPQLPFVELPAYDVHYKYESMPLNISLQTRKIFNAIRGEYNFLRALKKLNNFDTVVSDNRFGCYHKDCHNFFITHQIQVLLPNLFNRYLISKINRWFIHKFDECWVPDYEGSPNLSGEMSHDQVLSIPIRFLGPLSRFQKIEAEKDLPYLTLSILSGPEPQRSMLEQRLTDILRNVRGNHAIIRGTTSISNRNSNISFFGLLGQHEISTLVEQSRNVISRSGYSSIMDYEAMDISAILIPTPGQYEQLFLAEHMEKLDRHKVIYQNQLSKDSLVKLLNI